MFTYLYVKTNYSLLSSLISIDSLIEFAKSKNIKQIAICDDNLTSFKNFYNKCISNDIKPILGIDIRYEEDNILLYAKDYVGYQNLIKLSTIMSETNISLEYLRKYNKSIIAILPYNSLKKYEDFKKIYDDFYIGIQNIKQEEEIIEMNLNPVFINKLLYLDKNKSKYLKYLFMIRDSKTISDNIHFIDNYNYPIEDEVISLVSNVSLNNTNIIADKCNVIIEKRNDLLPVYDEKVNCNHYLTVLSLAGLNKRLNFNVPEKYKIRLKYELEIIKNMDFSNYFLVVYDFIRYAKKSKILVGPGRGSAAGSLVAYCLGITDIDPIKYDLLFERFLNPERVTMPDIDTDFPDIYRQKVIDYVKQKYGEKRVGGIITFGTMASKLAIRDVGRVLNIPLKTIDSLCKCIPTITKLKLKDFYNDNEKFRNLIESTDKLKLLYEISNIIEGFPRHASTHAAGIVMSCVDLDDVIPLVKNDDGYVSGYTMEYLEELGLLKMDFLGIKNLTTIMNIISDIEKNENIEIDFSRIALDDIETLKIFEEANTCGIFQFESEGMKNFLKKLKPNSIEDIFAAIALFRPGPAVNIDTYIRRKHRLENVDYIDPCLKDILESTYGIIIYQEQIMQIAHIYSGFTLGEADILRRAMSKKKFDLLKSYEQKFIDGALSNGHDKEKSKKIFDLILNFANYGFNKSHSVSYSIVAYKMAYLKAKYPKYFFANLLSSVIGSEEKTKEYIDEARKLGIKILLPDINKSTNKYEILSDGILFPFSNIKNVGIMTCKDIVNSRTNQFIDIYDCFSKIVCRNVNKSTIESLINASVFDSFGFNKKTLHYNLDNLLNYALLTKDLDSEFVIKPVIEIQKEYEKIDLLSLEKESFGFYLSNHPTALYKGIQNNYIDIVDVPKYFNKNINIVSLIEKIKVIKTKNNDRMAFMLVSDETSQMDVILFPKIYEQYKNIDKGSVVLINGDVAKRFDKYQIVVKKLEIIEIDK